MEFRCFLLKLPLRGSEGYSGSQGNRVGIFVGSVDCQRAMVICEEGGCCLEQWCLYIHQLKSGFSRMDFGPLFIHDS